MTTLAVFRTFPGALAHNPFVLDTLVFMAYDHDGVQVWSIKDPSNPFHVAYYYTDTTTGAAAGGDYNGFEGCWGVYPYFPSGTIIASDRNNGLITLNLDPYTPPPVGLHEDGKNKGIATYPNPSQGKFTLSLESAFHGDLKVFLLEVSGKRVYSGLIDGKFGKYDFDFSEFPKGMYMLRVHGLNYEKAQKIILN